MSFSWSNLSAGSIVTSSVITSLQSPINTLATEIGVTKPTYPTLSQNAVIKRDDLNFYRDYLDTLEENNYCKIEFTSNYSAFHGSEDITILSPHRGSEKSATYGNVNSNADRSYDGSTDSYCPTQKSGERSGHDPDTVQRNYQ